MDKVNRLIDGQLDKLHSFKEGSYGNSIPAWKDRTIRMLKESIVEEELNLFAQIEEDTWNAEVPLYKKMLEEIKQGVNETPEFFLIKQHLETPEKASKSVKSSSKKTISNKVFVYMDMIA